MRIPRDVCRALAGRYASDNRSEVDSAGRIGVQKMYGGTPSLRIIHILNVGPLNSGGGDQEADEIRTMLAANGFVKQQDGIWRRPIRQTRRRRRVQKMDRT
jgi:hypothetical protein